ncbi:unnamed protein product [Meganyctiphanes norvegica]|uniref:Uncharacterized protein n=1 Tax=Meganyctiphanes norvegica TaxID=48144 RepID=A0AAV2QW62_MEGNR
MHHCKMSKILARLFGLVFAITSVVRGEIDLLAEPEVLSLDYAVNDDLDLLKETEYDLLLQDDELLSALELDDELGGDVMVDIGDDGDITLPPPLLVDDVATITDVIEEEEAAAVGPEADAEASTVTDGATTTEKDVTTTHTTDPRLERFAERLELLTLPPDVRKRRKIELKLQKISVEKTEEQDKKRELRKQKRIERREKKKLEKIEKKKRANEKRPEKNKNKKGKPSTKKKDDKKNDNNIFTEGINDKESSVEKKNNIKEIQKDKKKLEKKKKLDEKRKLKEEKKVENIEKRKAKHLRKGKDRNLRILKHMIDREEKGVQSTNKRKNKNKQLRKENRNIIEYRKKNSYNKREEKGVPSTNKRKNKNKQSRKENKNRIEYRKNNRCNKRWRNMKDRVIKRRKEIQFLLRLKRGFGARLDNEHKNEVTQQLRKLKLKFENDKKKVINFQKNNWKLIEENKLFSKLNNLKKKIGYLGNKRKQHMNAANSNYKAKLSKRIKYLKNKYNEIKTKIMVMENFSHRITKMERKYKPNQGNEMKLKEKIEKQVKKYKKYRKMGKISNESKKERKTRELKEKIISLKKKSMKDVDSIGKTKLMTRINDLKETYMNMRDSTKYEKINNCYIREDHESKNFLKMQNLKAHIKSLKNRLRQFGFKDHPKYRTKLKTTIRNLVKKYKKNKRLEKNRNETKTERKGRKLREEITSLMKIKKKSKDQIVKEKLSKRIKRLVEGYKKTRKIIRYENKYECKYFSKLKKIKDKITLLKAQRNQDNFNTNPMLKMKLTKMIENRINLYEKYKRKEKIRNETENQRKLRKLKEETKSLRKIIRSTADLNIKAKLGKRLKSLRRHYKNTYLIVKYEANNREIVRRSYEGRKISKYYSRMEKLKTNIKSLIIKKRQIGNEIDPKYKLKLMKRIKKLVNMYKKNKIMEKKRTETKKEMKCRKIKDKLKALSMQKEKSIDSIKKAKLSKTINGLLERYKKMHNIVKYEKRNKCYLRQDDDSRDSIRIEKLKEEIKSFISKQRKLRSDGDIEHKTKLRKRIKSLIKRYRKYKTLEKIKYETKKERKNRNLKEKIKSLLKLRKQSNDQNIRNNLTQKIKRLVKRYKKMVKIIKYENKYECKYFKRVQKLKEKTKELKIQRRKISGNNFYQQKMTLSKRISKLIKRYRKINSMEKIRKETENGKELRRLKEEIKSLVVLKKKAPNLNEKEKLSKKITNLKNSKKNIYLIVKCEEKDMEQISKSYENRHQSKNEAKMEKLRSKIRSLKKKKSENNIKSPKNKYLERRGKRGLRQRRNYISSKQRSKLEEDAKRKRQQRKLRLRKRKGKREKIEIRRRKGAARSGRRNCRRGDDCGKASVIPEGMAYCKNKQSKSGASCQCWYLQQQM